MSTIVAIPVRVKPPPAETGETVFAALRVLRNHHPREWRPHRAVLHVLLCHPDLRVAFLV